MKYKIHTVFFSPTNTTKKIVNEIALQLNPNFSEVNISLPKDRSIEREFTDKDLVIIGSPVYAGRIPKLIEDYYKTFKGNKTIVIPIVLYGNREYDDALLEMKDIFSDRGFITIAGAAFIGEHSYTNELATNRLDAKDLKIARQFGLEIKEKLDRIILNPAFLDRINLEVKGNYPYRVRKDTLPIGPKTLDSCIECGICKSHCPVSAISENDYKVVIEEECIECFSCVKRCNVKAKYFNERLDPVKKWLIDNYSKLRKEPELFL